MTPSVENETPSENDIPKYKDLPLRRALLSGVAAAVLTLFGGYKFMNENPDIFEPMHTAPQGMKHKFEINAMDVSAFAKTDTEACLAYAFADYVDPLKEKLLDVLPLTHRVVSQKQEISYYEMQILLERQRLYREYTAQGLEINQETIYSSRIDEYEQAIFEINERLIPQEQEQQEIVYGTLEQFDSLILHLNEQGLLDNLPIDQLVSAYQVIDLTKAIIGSADSDSTRAIYLATDLLSAIGKTWYTHEIDYLPLIQEDMEIRRIITEWKTPTTPEEQEKAQEILTQLAGRFHAHQFGNTFKGIIPEIGFSFDERKDLLASFDRDVNTIFFNSNPEALFWKNPKLMVETIIHEGAHALLDVYSHLYLSGKRNTFGTPLSSYDLEAYELVYRSGESYIEGDENYLTYYSNPHEVAARRAGKLVWDIMQSDKAALRSFQEEYGRFADDFTSHRKYQQGLTFRGKILCDDFNMPLSERPNFISRNIKRYALNNPHHFIP